MPKVIFKDVIGSQATLPVAEQVANLDLHKCELLRQDTVCTDFGVEVTTEYYIPPKEELEMVELWCGKYSYQVSEELLKEVKQK